MKKSLSLVLVMLMILGMCVSALAEEPVSFSVTFLKNDWHGDPNNMEIMQKLEEEANVDVDWQIYSNATWSEKKNLIINSGELPDVFYMNAVNATDVAKYGPQGMFLDLTDLIDQYCPNLKTVMESNPTFKALCTNPDDGKIYSVSRAVEREANTLAGQMYIYKPWLDKLNLEVPTDYESFYQVLKAFKEQDPNGNGQADELPFAFSNMSFDYGFGNLFGMFGYGYNLDYGLSCDGITVVGDEVVFVPRTENYKEAIAYFNRMFTEGLFSAEDYATQDSKLLNSKLHSEEVTVGCFIAFDANIVVPAERLDDYVQMEPMAGPRGDRVWMQSGNPNNMGGTQFVMTYKAKGKEEAIMRWLDAHFEKTNSIELFLGSIGTNLEYDENGMLVYIPTPEGQSYSEFRYANCPVHVPCAISADQWNKDVQIMDEDADRWVYMEEVLKPYLTQRALYQYVNDEDSKYLTSHGKDIRDYVRTTEARWMTAGGVEEEWDEYLERLDAMGIDEYVQVKQGILDRFQNAGK